MIESCNHTSRRALCRNCYAANQVERVAALEAQVEALTAAHKSAMRCNVEILDNEVKPLRAQLAEAQRTAESHKKAWVERVDMCIERDTQLQSQAAQLAGMREALKYLHDNGHWCRIQEITGKVLSTPASDYEKRAQGLVEATRQLLASWPEHSPGEWSWKMRSPDPADDKLARALAAWEGTS